MACHFKSHYGEGELMVQSASIGAVAAGDLFKTLVWDGVVMAATKALIAAVPFLGFGPLGIVTGVVVSIFANFVYEQLKGIYDFESIGFKNEAHRQAYDDAGVKLKLIARDHGIDSPEFKQAREVHREALSVFVQFHSPN